MMPREDLFHEDVITAPAYLEASSGWMHGDQYGVGGMCRCDKLMMNDGALDCRLADSHLSDN